jgi:hypothetical protein
MRRGGVSFIPLEAKREALHERQVSMQEEEALGSSKNEFA